MPKPDTMASQIHASQVKRILDRLVDASVWFSVTPYPDDWYKVEVKNDAVGVFLHAMTD